MSYRVKHIPCRDTVTLDNGDNYQAVDHPGWIALSSVKIGDPVLVHRFGANPVMRVYGREFNVRPV